LNSYQSSSVFKCLTVIYTARGHNLNFYVGQAKYLNLNTENTEEHRGTQRNTEEKDKLRKVFQAKVYSRVEYNYKDCLFDADKYCASDEFISLNFIHLSIKLNDMKLAII